MYMGAQVRTMRACHLKIGKGWRDIEVSPLKVDGGGNLLITSSFIPQDQLVPKDREPQVVPFFPVNRSVRRTLREISYVRLHYEESLLPSHKIEHSGDTLECGVRDPLYSSTSLKSFALEWISPTRLGGGKDDPRLESLYDQYSVLVFLDVAPVPGRSGYGQHRGIVDLRGGCIELANAHESIQPYEDTSEIFPTVVGLFWVMGPFMIAETTPFLPKRQTYWESHPPKGAHAAGEAKILEQSSSSVSGLVVNWDPLGGKRRFSGGGQFQFRTVDLSVSGTGEWFTELFPEPD